MVVGKYALSKLQSVKANIGACKMMVVGNVCFEQIANCEYRCMEDDGGGGLGGVWFNKLP